MSYKEYVLEEEIFKYRKLYFNIIEDNYELLNENMSLLIN